MRDDIGLVFNDTSFDVVFGEFGECIDGRIWGKLKVN